jgi:hypothetical protein
MFFARRQRLYQITAAVLFALIAGAVIAPTVTRDAQGATTITVVNTNDAGVGSLRQAITDAAGGDTIDFAPGLSGQTITLTSGELSINKNLTISGPAPSITVSGNNSSRVFIVGGVVTVNISNLTVLDGNTVGSGGGILISSSTLNLTNSTVSGNTATNNGGGIYNLAFSTTHLINSTISGNTATYGGGIENTGSSTLNMTNSTISGNSSGYGGGVLNAGIFNMTNSSVSGNTAPDGGGIYNGNIGTVNLTNSTVSGNSATTGGGIANYGTVNLTNSIVANQASGGDCAGSLATSAGYNLDSDGSCNLTATGDLPNTNPMLSPLALNPPGKTKTHALQPGSAAINRIPAGVNGCGTTVATDQRGVARPEGTHCDIGAYEIDSAPPVIWGNINCLNGILPDDALALVVHVAGAQQSPLPGAGCPDIGDAVGGRTWGNVDCLAGIDLADAVAVLKHLLGLAYDRAAGCPAIGDSVQIS